MTFSLYASIEFEADSFADAADLLSEHFAWMASQAANLDPPHHDDLLDYEGVIELKPKHSAINAE